MQRLFQRAKRLITMCLVTLLIVTSALTISPAPAQAATTGNLIVFNCESGSNCGNLAAFAAGVVSGSAVTLIATGHAATLAVAGAAVSSATVAVSGTIDATIKLWNLQTGKLLFTLTGHSTAVLSVAISLDGKTLASASRDGIIKFWNLHTGELLQTISGCSPVAFSSDGKTLVSGANGGSIKIWTQMQSFDKFTLDSVLSGEWWEVFGVNQSNRPKDVKLAYLRLARLYHPDVNSSV